MKQTGSGTMALITNTPTGTRAAPITHLKGAASWMKTASGTPSLAVLCRLNPFAAEVCAMLQILVAISCPITLKARCLVSTISNVLSNYVLDRINPFVLKCVHVFLRGLHDKCEE